MSYIIYIVPLLFIGMFVFANYLLYKFGWEDLVASYKTSATFVGKRIGLSSIAVNTVSYQNAVIVKYNAQGMYLRTVIFLRIFHKPVFIPWNEVKHVRDKKIFFFSFKELIIGDPFVASIKMRPSLYKRIEAFIKK